MSDPLSLTALGRPRTWSSDPEAGLLAELKDGLAERGMEGPPGEGPFEWAEYLALALADEIVFTNAAQRDLVLDLYDDPAVAAARSRSVVVPHPTPPSQLYHRVRSDHVLEEGPVHIGYFGNFYASQQPRAVLGACGMLSPQDRRRVRLHVFTADPEGVAATAEELGASDVIIARPQLDYLEFLQLATRMDLLLALDAASASGGTPVLLSKWSDYLGAGTPVWGVVHEGSELARQQLAYRSPAGHLTAALQTLTRIARAGPRGVSDR